MLHQITKEMKKVAIHGTLMLSEMTERLMNDDTTCLTATKTTKHEEDDEVNIFVLEVL